MATTVKLTQKKPTFADVTAAGLPTASPKTAHPLFSVSTTDTAPTPAHCLAAANSSKKNKQQLSSSPGSKLSSLASSVATADGSETAEALRKQTHYKADDGSHNKAPPENSENRRFRLSPATPKGRPERQMPPQEKSPSTNTTNGANIRSRVSNKQNYQSNKISRQGENQDESAWHMAVADVKGGAWKKSHVNIGSNNMTYKPLSNVLSQSLNTAVAAAGTVAAVPSPEAISTSRKVLGGGTGKDPSAYILPVVKTGGSIGVKKSRRGGQNGYNRVQGNCAGRQRNSKKFVDATDTYNSGGRRGKGQNSLKQQTQQTAISTVVYELTPDYFDALTTNAVCQIEYFFSIDELSRNVFLRCKMDVEGYLPAAIIFNFPSVASYGIPYYDLLAAVSAKSKKVEVDKINECLRVKGNYQMWLYPNTEGGFGCPKWIKQQTIEGSRETEHVDENSNKADYSETQLTLDDKTNFLARDNGGGIDMTETVIEHSVCVCPKNNDSHEHHYDGKPDTSINSIGSPPDLASTDSDTDHTDGDSR